MEAEAAPRLPVVMGRNETTGLLVGGGQKLWFKEAWLLS